MHILKVNLKEHLANLASDRLVDVEKYIEDVKKREAISTTEIGEGDAHLKILQTLAISLMDDDFKEEILGLDNKETLVNLLLDKTNN